MGAHDARGGGDRRARLRRGEDVLTAERDPAERAARARDARAVCLHEHAHHVVARHLGVAGYVTVVPLPHGAAAGAYYAGSFRALPADDGRAMRLVGLAGRLAELLDASRGLQAGAVMAGIADGRVAFSDADRDLIGRCDAGDVAECLALLRRHWPEIVGDAQLHAAALLAATEG